MKFYNSFFFFFFSTKAFFVVFISLASINRLLSLDLDVISCFKQKGLACYVYIKQCYVC